MMDLIWVVAILSFLVGVLVGIVIDDAWDLYCKARKEDGNAHT